MKFLKIIFFLSLLISFSFCSTAKKAFENKKKNSTDEFLVEKKSPLVLPPDYNKLPVPNNEEKLVKDTNDIKDLIKKNTKKTDLENLQNSNQNLEDKILNKIK